MIMIMIMNNVKKLKKNKKIIILKKILLFILKIYFILSLNINEYKIIC